MATQAFFKILSQLAVPTFVQGVGSDLNDNNGITGNSFKFNLPNNTLGGNYLVLAVGYASSATRTIAVTDSTGDTWVASPKAGTQSAGNMTARIYVLQNASAGLHQITVTFDAQIKPFNYAMAEFYNVNGAVDGSNKADSVAGTAAATGSYTPTTNNDANGGHLIFTYAISNDPVGTGAGTQASAISKTGGVAPKFMHANNICTIPQASSFDVQATNAAINPGFNFTQSSGTNFVVTSVAIKAANAGVAPAAGIRIKRVLHYSNVNPQNGTNNIKCPADGNLLVVAMAAGNNLNLVTSISDNKGNGNYTARSPAGVSQIFDAQNATSGDDTVVNMNMNGAGQPQYSMHFYDVVNAQASSFLNGNSFNGSAPASGSVINDFPDITPNSAPGLTITQCGFGTASQSAMASGAPAGSVFDGVVYTTTAPLFDQDRMDNADPFGHANYATTTLQTWNWVIGSDTFSSTAFAMACCYK